MEKTSERYVPAMGVDALLSFYDPLQRWLLREHHYKGRLVEYAEIVGDIEDNLAGRIPELMSAAGFRETLELGHHTTVVGSFSYYRGEKSA